MNHPALPLAQARAAGEHYFRKLLDKLPAGAYLCDPDGLITYYNRQAVELWGRTPGLNDPADRYCGSLRLFTADGTPVRHEQCWMALTVQKQQPHNGCEIVIERPDGRRLTALAYPNPIHDDDGRFLGAVNVLVDVTEQRRVTDQLRRANADRAAQLADLTRLHEMSMRLATTLELQPILQEILQTATAIVGTGKGLISLWDEEAGLLKVGASLGLDRDLLRLIETVPPGTGACGLCFQQGRRVFIEDVDSDPRFVPYRDFARQAGFRAVASTPLLTRAGRNIGALSVHFRVPRLPTEREAHLLDLCARQAVDFIENARLYARLQEADRRKDEFLATLAHELRNPLAPIQNAVHILAGSAALDPGLRWARDVIERQVRQMTRLVDDLLDLSRITRGKLELRRTRVTLQDVVAAGLEVSRPVIEACGHELKVAMPFEPVALDGDLTRLGQVVANLLNNAAKYTERGGEIRLEAERQGSDAVLTVSDTGIGIAPEMLARVFEMFTQAEAGGPRAQGGLGIGLTLAKQLVEMHGGTIDAFSAGPGTGSRFTVRLPAAPPSAAETRGGATAGVERPAGPALRILVVDDNRDAAASLAMLLRIIGHETRTAGDGEEAVALAEEFRPDVALLDIGLPKVSGLDVARRIRAQPWGRGTALIATTGWGQEADRRRSQEAGFDHHLVKPVEPATLLRLLGTVHAAVGELAATR